MQVEQVDVAVIGGGIVGLAAARAILARRPGASVVVLEKEATVGAHQSGRNSGVLHTGVYYAPGSLKSQLVREGRAQLLELCDAHDVAVHRLGKAIVATHARQRASLVALADRARTNGIEHDLLDAAAMRRIEPFARGVAALHLPSAAVVDFALVCRVLAQELRAAGASVRTATTVTGAQRSAGAITLHTSATPVRARLVVACAGLHAQRVARLLHARRCPVRVVPFRGEYYALRPSRAHLVRGLVYPVPDPSLPFLGVHLTRDTNGRVHVGPNAVLALALEGYRRGDVRLAQAARTVGDPAMLRLMMRHRRTGVRELVRSRSPARFAASARALIGGISPDDLVALPAGVRAQAVRPDGTLLDDFAFMSSDRAVSVLNAPSPAATASLAIGEHLADVLLRPTSSPHRPPAGPEPTAPLGVPSADG